MALRVDDEECLGCGACESACPKGAISQSTGFPVTYLVDPLLCNDCNLCLVVCPVVGLLSDAGWAVCHGRGCPLSSHRYEGWECSEGVERCERCGAMLWRPLGGEWTCSSCRGAGAGAGHVATCPKIRRAARLAAAGAAAVSGASGGH
ncbi:MAG: indolepyruvate ferredoxin oxidoreductase subunit alpha [Acidimicrobiales bacterium]